MHVNDPTHVGQVVAFSDDSELAQGLAQEAGVPFTSFGETQFDPKAIALVPEAIARRFLIAPKCLTDDVLEVVQADPLDVLAIDELQRISGKPAQVLCATPHDVLQMINRMYGHSDTSTALNAPTITATCPVSDSQDVMRLDELGFSRRHLALFHEMLAKSAGIILVAGPSGAGKTRTVYSALGLLAERGRKVRTVEDPIEYQHPLLHQTEVQAGDSCTAVLRTVMRQSLDVLMISDVSDRETAELAVQVALSGVLVLSTVRAPDSATALRGLIDLGVEPHLLASAMLGAVAQRLVRVTCRHCCVPVRYPAVTLQRAGLGGGEDVVLARGQGCHHCGGTGYRGRTGVFEVLTINPAVQSLVEHSADSRTIENAAIKTGMMALPDHALSKAILSQTTLDEVIRIAQ